MFKEFKEFAMKGNLIDIAVGFVMGVNSFKRKEEATAPGPTGPSDNDLLSEIRDLLKK